MSIAQAKHVNLKQVLLWALLLLTSLGVGLYGTSVQAAGNAGLSLSPASGTHKNGTELTVAVYENSGSASVSAVDVTLAYDATKLQFVSARTADSPFQICPQASGGGGSVTITCATVNSSPITGSNQIGTVVFKPLVSAGTTAVTFRADSEIVSANGSNNIWNESTAGGSYTFAAPGVSTTSSTKSSTETTSAAVSNLNSGYSASSSASQQVNPKTPIAVNEAADAMLQQSGYMVAVTVLDADKKPVSGASVSLGNQTTTTDDTGVASFLGVPAGTHTVAVKSEQGNTSSSITVTDEGSPTDVQELTAKLVADSSPTSYVLIPVAAILLLAGGFILSQTGTLQKLSAKSAPKRKRAAVPHPPAESETLTGKLKHIHTDTPKPSEVITPIEPPKHS